MSRRADRATQTTRRSAWRSSLARRGVRRWIAALLAAATVGGALHLVLARPAPDDVPALVAARALPLGAVVGAGDVEVRMLPPRALPDSALRDPTDAAGEVAVAPVVAGEVLTRSDLRTSGLLSGMPPGTVAVFVPLQDVAVAAAVRAGDVVDVHSPVDGSVVADGSRVLRSLTDGDATGLWLAVDPPTAAALAAARGADPLGAALLVALRAQEARE